jgi:UDP-N-acetylmuramate: L-alanyl-gamma-D-glutamyl-meso-diaminopimelate ligase
MARIHLIAIGGSAMHNLALELQVQGNQVSGSDDHFFEPSKSRLQTASLLPNEEGWFPNRISSDIDLIILGMHAQKDNPELARAQMLGLVIMSYPEYLHEQSKECTRVVIAGSHGKTSITSMVLHVMQQAGQSVNYLVGAQIDGFDRMVRLDSDADFILIEGDEYGSSPLDPQPKFLWYKPHIALISGIAWDHANIFPSEEGYKAQFAAFIRTIEDSGTLLYCSEDKDLETLVHAQEASIRTVPYATPGSRPAEEGCLLLTPEGEVPLRIFGGHNMQNLEGARLPGSHGR